MFDDIGKKIKGVASGFCWLGILASLAIGMIWLLVSSETMRGDEEAQVVGVLGGLGIMVGGSISSWLSSIVLYGFGELVDNSATLVTLMQNRKKRKEAAPTQHEPTPSPAPDVEVEEGFAAPFSEEELRKKLEDLYDELQRGAISEEEFEKRRQQLLDRYFGNA